MNLKTTFSALLLCISMQSFAQNSGMQTMPNGVKYKIHTSSTSPKIKINDVVTFHLIQKTDKDSILVSSYESGEPFSAQVQQPRESVDIMTLFPLLAERDSASFKIPTDSIFKGNEASRPPFFPKGSYLAIEMKIEKVQSMEEAMAEYQKEMEKMKANEATALSKYLTEKNLKPLSTASGLKYIITKPSVKAKPVNGDTVFVNYVGSTLDGKVFDSSIEAEAKKAGLEQPGRTYEPISFVLGQGQVIKGWEEGLLLLNEGAKATFLIPSELGYGPQGAGEHIKPFSTLRFDLELVKVKKPKKASASTSTPPAKKPATPVKKATPTKKPVAAPAKKPAGTSTAKPKSSPK